MIAGYLNHGCKESALPAVAALTQKVVEMIRNENSRHPHPRPSAKSAVKNPLRASVNSVVNP